MENKAAVLYGVISTREAFQNDEEQNCVNVLKVWSLNLFPSILLI